MNAVSIPLKLGVPGPHRGDGLSTGLERRAALSKPEAAGLEGGTAAVVRAIP